jgi:hypothetical protein
VVKLSSFFVRLLLASFHQHQTYAQTDEHTSRAERRREEIKKARKHPSLIFDLDLAAD